MTKRTTLLTLFMLTLTASANAQPPEPSPPTEEHKWLEKFVGEWTTSMNSVAGPGVPEMKYEGKVTGRMLGGYWLVNEMKSNLGEVEMQALQTVGYDPEKKKYVGTWVDNMMNLMWHYEGSVDESGKILTLEAEGPNMLGGEGKSKYRDVYEFKSDDEIAATSQVQGPDGEWVTFMNGTYKRVKE